MNTNFAIIGLRLLGIYCFVVSIQYLPFLLPLFEQDERPALMLLLSIAPMLFFILIGIVLLKTAKPIATRITTDLIELDASGFEQLQPVLISVVGVLIFGLSIRPFFVELMQLITLSQAQFAEDLIPQNAIKDTWMRLASHVIQFVLGLVLFFQSKTITRFWNRVRTWDPGEKSGGRA